jgi:hypothetical protein
MKKIMKKMNFVKIVNHCFGEPKSEAIETFSISVFVIKLKSFKTLKIEKMMKKMKNVNFVKKMKNVNHYFVIPKSEAIESLWFNVFV